MLVRMTIWEGIRDQFSEEEKAELNRAVAGEAICPRGLIVDLDALSALTRGKLLGADHIEKHREARQREAK